MNYKDIVKRLKGFDFSKRQKETLANIVSNAGGGGVNTFEITLNAFDESNINLMLDGETFAIIVESTSESLVTYKIRSRKLFAKLKDIICNKKYFLIVNFIGVSPEYGSPILCNTLMSGNDVLSIYITFETTLKININNTD